MELLSEKSTPPVLAALLDRLREAAPAEYDTLEEEVKLTFHYDGRYVAYRNTPLGIEILATGSAEKVRDELAKQSVVGTEDRPVCIRTPKSFKELYLTLRLGFEGGIESGAGRS